jgi:penicillin-binding protein 2
METLISSRKQSWLIWFLRGILILIFLVLFGRLFELTVIRGAYFRSLSDGNRIRRIPIVAPRGEILARGGEVLAGSIEEADLGDKVLTENKGIMIEWTRRYLQGSNFAHMTGYLGEVSAGELGKVAGKCPDKGPRILGSLIGRGGLEEAYDCQLSGIDGEFLLEVDAYGKNTYVLGRRNPKPGEDLRTHIDFGLQEIIPGLIEGKKAAVIVTTPDGEVLSLFSSPSYDPNVFVEKDGGEERKKYLVDDNLPLFNRVIGGAFHPGSVYKPFVAIASLEEGKIDERFKFRDEGQIVIKTLYGTYSYRNWYFTQYGGTEGDIGLVRAMGRSTDTFFYKIGEMTGIDAIVAWSEKFGFNKKAGIDIPGEIQGLVPSPDWKLNVKGERWFLGNTYHLSIGQGDLAVTPIAVNSAIAAIANEGKICTPKIVGETQCSSLDIDQANLNLVIEGMKAACTSGGTGYIFFDFEQVSGVKVACKTGTAEDEGKKPHAWFTVFAPVDNPEIVATVLVENAGEGSSEAGPIAREIFNYWFKVIPPPQPEADISSEDIPVQNE